MLTTLQVAKGRPRLKSFLAAFFLVILFNNCSVRLTPQYNAELENQIINAAKMTDKLYLEMIDAPADKKNYILYRNRYLQVETEINSILFKNQHRAKAEDFVASVKKLKDKFVQYKDDHKTKNKLSNGELKAYNAYLQGLWAPVLTEEQALNKPK